MEDKRKLRLLGRREAMQILGVGLAAGGIAGLAACNKKEPAPQAAPTTPAPAPTTPTPSAAAPTPTGPMTCESPIDPAATQLRTTLQYKDVAAIPEKHCSACQQFKPGMYGECGGCNLFAGPVKPNGGCIGFAPRDPNAPAAPAPTQPG